MLGARRLGKCRNDESPQLTLVLRFFARFLYRFVEMQQALYLIFVLLVLNIVYCVGNLVLHIFVVAFVTFALLLTATRLCNDMVFEQKFSLDLMDLNNSLITLMRRKEKLLSAKVSNADEKCNLAECNALCNLVSGNEEWGMAGLPLAIVQAGNFVKKKKSFAAYVELYKKMWNNPEVQRLLSKEEETGLGNYRKQTVLTA